MSKFMVEQGLKRLLDEKHTLQIKISRFFEYGKFPTDQGFDEIREISDSLRIVQEKIDLLEELLDYLNVNP